jgi:hypothetical protein
MKNRLAAIGVMAVIAGIGLIAALISGREFAGPLGGGIGFVVGLLIAVVETIRAPKDDRSLVFAAWVSNGLPGGRRREDARLMLVFWLFILCGFSAVTWQIIFAILRG